MFGIGSTELVIIIVIAFLLFGPDKLPQLARTVGRFIGEFKKIQDEMELTMRAEMYKVDLSPTPKSTTSSTSSPGSAALAASESSSKSASSDSSEGSGEKKKPRAPRVKPLVATYSGPEVEEEEEE